MKPALPTTTLKLSVLYGQPQDSAAFEAYYLGTHMPLVAAAPAPARAEASLGLPEPDGSKPPFYRLFEAWFDSAEHLAAVTGSPEWQRVVVADIPKFATGGVTILLSQQARATLHFSRDEIPANEPKQGINSISLNPDTVVATWQALAE